MFYDTLIFIHPAKVKATGEDNCTNIIIDVQTNTTVTIPDIPYMIVIFYLIKKKVLIVDSKLLFPYVPMSRVPD